MNLFLQIHNYDKMKYRKVMKFMKFHLVSCLFRFRLLVGRFKFSNVMHFGSTLELIISFRLCVKNSFF